MENEFDLIILGTGLTESITAAALATAGLKVAHVDPNPYYGGDEATLALDELVTWAERNSSSDHADQEAPSVKYQVEHHSGATLSHSKQYTISLSPSVIPAVGPFITSVIASRIGRYISFKLLGPVLIFHDGRFTNVPRRREDVFTDEKIPLIGKRRLMRFLMFAAGEFEDSPQLQGKEDAPFLEFLRSTFLLSEELAQTVVFALAYCSSATDATLPALHRVRSCLRSTGRYGPSPFLVGYYGGSGELAQGFCRTAAVNGGVYILGRRIVNIRSCDPSSQTGASSSHRRHTIELDDFPEPLYASHVLSSPAHVPAHLRPRVTPICSESPGIQPHVRAVARAIAVLDGVLSPPQEDEGVQTELGSDSFFMVFPPGSVEGGSAQGTVHALTAGPGTMCTPAGKSIVYLSMALLGDERGSKDLLEPYLDKISSTRTPPHESLFEVFYTLEFPAAEDDGSPETGRDDTFSVLPLLPPDISHTVDCAAQIAETAFHKVLSSIRPDASLDVSHGFWVNTRNEVVEDQE